MTLQHLHHSIHKHAQDVAELCDEIGDDFQQAAVHDFRTTIKKIRALLRWQHKGGNIFKGPFGKIYHAAGRVRDLHVLLATLHKEKTTIPFIQWLEEELDHSKKSWKKLYRRKIIRHFQKEIEQISTNVSGHTAFFREKTEEIQWIIHMPSIDDIALHEIRKILKDMQYVTQWCQVNKIPIPSLSSLRLKENGKKIGAYNDLRIGIELLDVYLAQETHAGIILDLKDLKQKWLTQKEKQKVSLMRSLSIVDKISSQMQ
ncbi:MAG: CHAD domain-containing protein [Bacteroidota bacterium]